MRISDWSSDVCSSDLEQADRDQEDRPERVVDGLFDRIPVDVQNDRPDDPELVAYRQLDTKVVRRQVAERRMVCDPRRLVRVLLREIGRASCRERVCQYV